KSHAVHCRTAGQNESSETNMNEPRRHHYIPQFYLSNWCNADGDLWSYHRIPTKLIINKVRPKSAGYEKELYTLAHLPAEARQSVEKYVTADVDNRAATALQKMTKSKSAEGLTGKDRLGWAQFIVSLPIRNPDAVADIKQESTKSGMEKAYEKAKQTFPDWAE